MNLVCRFDFRPVAAILDIDITNVDENKREDIFMEVIEDQGPPDGTIVVRRSTPDVEFEDEMVETILTTFGEVGEIILVR